MLVTLFLTPPCVSNYTLQFQYFSPRSSLNPKRNNPRSRTFKVTKTPQVSLRLPNAKVPTPPWMNSPPPPQPHELVFENNNHPPWEPTSEKQVERAGKALTNKESGVRGTIAMRRIIRNIEKLQDNKPPENSHKGSDPFELSDCFDKIGGGDGEQGFGGKMPWSKADKVVLRRMKKERVERRADLILEKGLLERLRVQARKMRKWIKVMKAGVTDDVVHHIKLTWRSSELAMLKFEIPLCRNMERAREIVELKTGGLVVWSWKSFLVIYRGSDYPSSSKFSLNMHLRVADDHVAPLSKLNCLNLEAGVSGLESDTTSTVDEVVNGNDVNEDALSSSIFLEKNVGSNLIDRSLYEREGDRLLDGLGPRFVDWWMWKPLPVDGDLLPEVVPGFRPPFRRCPPDVRSKLTDNEFAYLRKLAHPLPTHFVLGRNRGLQGLAAAIIKLWEKSQIAKIALKWGALNTNNEQMAYELKSLTGGVLLLRNKYYIILYRGKDFLPSGVESLVAERENELGKCQLQEESARMKAAEIICVPDEPQRTSEAGTLSEFLNILTEFGDAVKGKGEFELKLEADIENIKKELKKQERKLFILNMKIEKSTKVLSQLNSTWKPGELDGDQELITDEERECLRKIGLKMHSSILLGRRGIFDGVIEGIRQHWKHREVVKVVTMQKLFVQVLYTAKWLVAESGGVLISVEKLKAGHGIIIYRGKNYKRPSLKTGNLLTKRKALERSLEMQRLGSLKFFAYERQRVITDLKLKLVSLTESKAEMQASKEKNTQSMSTVF